MLFAYYIHSDLFKSDLHSANQHDASGTKLASEYIEMYNIESSCINQIKRYQLYTIFSLIQRSFGSGLGLGLVIFHFLNNVSDSFLYNLQCKIPYLAKEKMGLIYKYY